MLNTIPLPVLAFGFIGSGLLLSITLVAFAVYSEVKLNKMEKQIRKQATIVPFSADVNWLLDDENIEDAVRNR